MSEYDLAFEQEVSAMTPAVYRLWNPKFTEAEALERIAAAKATVAKVNANSLFQEVLE